MMPGELVSFPAVCVFLVRMAVVTTVILLATWAAVALLRRRSAAVRHGLWLSAALGCWLAPLALAWIPATALVIRETPRAPAVRDDHLSADRAALLPPRFVSTQVPSEPALQRSHPFEAAAERPVAPIAEPAEIPADADLVSMPDAADAEFAIKVALEPWVMSWQELLSRAPAWIVSLWLVMAAGLMLRLGMALRATGRLRRASRPFDDASAAPTLQQLRRELTISAPVSLRLCAPIDVPMLCGIVRPCLLLPPEAEYWSPERLRAVLAHELGHVARRDLAAQFLADLASAAWWFQPLLWHAARRMRVEREFACDDLVLQTGTAACDYADELLAIAAQAVRQPLRSPVLVSMAGRKTIEQRLRAILDPTLNRIPLARRGTLLAIGAVVALSTVIAALTPKVSRTPSLQAAAADNRPIAEPEPDVVPKLDAAPQERNQEIKTVREDAILQRMAINHDGSLVATVGVTHDGSTYNSTVKLWDARTGELRKALDEEHDAHLEIDISRDLLAVGVSRDQKPEVRLLDAATGEQRAMVNESVLKDAWAITGMAFSPDGKKLAIAGMQHVAPFLKLWDVEKRQAIDATIAPQTVPGDSRINAAGPLVFSPDGEWLAAGCNDSRIRLFDGRTGEFRTWLEIESDLPFSFGIAGIAFSPDSRTLASGGLDQSLLLWDLSQGKPRRTLREHGAWVRAVAFSPDGTLLATNGSNNSVIVCDAETATIREKIPGGVESVNVLAFNSDGKTLAICAGGGREEGGRVTTAGALTLVPIKLSRDKPKEKPRQPEKKADTTSPRRDRIAGQVVDEAGQPGAGAQVVLETHRDDEPRTMADAEGRFELLVEADSWKWLTLTAQLDGGRQLGTALLADGMNDERRTQLKLTLGKTREVPIRVIDKNGHPLAAAMVGVIADGRDAGAAMTDASGSAVVLIPGKAVIHQVYALKADIGLDYRSFTVPRDQFNDRNAVRPNYPQAGITLKLDGVQPLQVALTTTDGRPLPGIPIYPWYLQKPGEPGELNLSELLRRKVFLVRTGDDGRLDFRWIPHWQEMPLTIWPWTQEFASQRGTYDPRTKTGKALVTLDRLVPIRGKVTFPDGSPAAGIVIDVSGAGYTFDSFRRSVRSTEDGAFEVKAAPNQVYLLVVKDSQWAAQPVTGFALWPDQPIDDLQFRLRPATRIRGRVTLGPEEQPVAGLNIQSYQYGVDAHSLKNVKLPNPENQNTWVQPITAHSTVTDADGRYELLVGPGQFDIRGPNQNKIEKFEIGEETEKTFDFHMSRPEKGILKGLVVSGDPPRPVAAATISGIERWHFGRDFHAVTNDEGRFEVERNLHLAAIHVESADRAQGTFLEVDADTTDVTMTLQKTASATGTLLDQGTREPLAEREIVYGIRVHQGDSKAPFQTAFGGVCTTDAQGRFTLDRLVVGGEYGINLTIEKGRSWTQVGKVTPTEPGPIDVGALTYKPQEEYRPATIEERMAAAFASASTPVERFAAALPDTRLSKLRVLTLFADPSGEAARQFMALRFEDKPIRGALDACRLIAVSTVGENLEAAGVLAARLGRDLNEGRAVFLALIADEDGNVLDAAQAGDLSDAGAISQDKVLAFLKKNTPAPLDAQTLFDEALARAKAENKRVIIQETATWCGPCWRLSRFLDKHRPLWEPDYVWIKMDHRWTGARELMEKIRDGSDGGIPWWAVLDADGKILATSNLESGDNIGFPDSPEGIRHFREMLQKTAGRMTAEQLDALVKALN